MAAATMILLAFAFCFQASCILGDDCRDFTLELNSFGPECHDGQTDAPNYMSDMTLKKDGPAAGLLSYDLTVGELLGPETYVMAVKYICADKELKECIKEEELEKFNVCNNKREMYGNYFAYLDTSETNPYCPNTTGNSHVTDQPVDILPFLRNHVTPGQWHSYVTLYPNQKTDRSKPVMCLHVVYTITKKGG